MIYVGIDAAKDKHYAVVTDEKGKVLVKAFPFFNDAEGFCKLQKVLSVYGKDELLIGIESTGIYSENLIFFLFGGGYKLVVLNPLETNKIRTIRSMRKLLPIRCVSTSIVYTHNRMLRPLNSNPFAVSDKI